MPDSPCLVASRSGSSRRDTYFVSSLVSRLKSSLVLPRLVSIHLVSTVVITLLLPLTNTVGTTIQIWVCLLSSGLVLSRFVSSLLVSSRLSPPLVSHLSPRVSLLLSFVSRLSSAVFQHLSGVSRLSSRLVLSLLFCG